MKRPIIIILLTAAALFVLAGIAATLFFVFGLGGGAVALSRPLVYATAEETKTFNTDGPITLSVSDDAGDVTVTGGEGDTVTVNVVKTASAFNQANAEEELKNIEYQIEQKGDTITITYDLPEINTNSLDTVDFLITVPAEATVSVDAGFGEVSIQNIEGGLTAETNSGRVDASGINAGSEDIELTSGFGRVSLQDASGRDVTLTSQSGTVEVKDVRASGDVALSTAFGDIEFRSGSANLLNVETSSGRVTLDSLTLKGAVTAKSEFGEISLDRVQAASYDLDTNSGSVTLDGARGKVRAHSGFGSVTVMNADAVTLDLSTQSGTVEFAGSLGAGPHTVNSEFGDIHLTLPADSSIDVDLKTAFGSISSEIPITVTLSGDVKQGHQTGSMNEGGAELTVETQSGGISIEASQ